MIKNYFKIAIAVLKRNKFFTFISLFGISCTLAVLMIISAFSENLFSSTYPEINSARSLYLINLHFEDPDKHNNINTTPTFSFLEKYIRSLKTPEKITIHSFPVTASAYLKNKKYDFKVMHTDSEFWDILSFKFIEGKPYTEQQILNSYRVVVISAATKKLYLGDISPLGKTFEAGNINYTVIGVVKDVPKTQFFTTADVYAPFTAPKSGYEAKGYSGNYNATILARSSKDFSKIDEEIQRKIPTMEMPDKNFKNIAFHADKYFASFTRMALGNNNSTGLSKVYIISIILLFLFFLLPTVNLVNINISRIMDRSSEIGVRKAFGASSKILIFQFLIENVIITFMGGVLGLIITQLALLVINNSGLIPNVDLSINLHVLMYGTLLCLIFGVFSGIYPAMKMSKLNIIKSLKSSS